jgi:predicted RNase H-like HicB family nuclease
MTAANDRRMRAGDMLVYTSAYRWQDGICLAEVLDFPGTVTFGHNLDEARTLLADALKLMAEVRLGRGEALPVPDPHRHDAAAEIEEPIYLVLHAGSRLRQRVAP